MSAAFASASSQYLLNSAAPVLAAPFTVGMWVYPTAASNSTFWSLADTAGASNYFHLRWLGASSLFQFTGVQSGSGDSATLAATADLNAWHFVLARVLSSGNLWLSVLLATGQAADAQNVRPIAPSGIDSVAIGALKTSAVSEAFDGSVADYWIANTDVQPDGLQTQDALLRQLAYGGPFSVPYTASNLVDYRALRSSLGSDQDVRQETASFSAGRQTWANTNGAVLGAHPPLPYWHEAPQSVTRSALLV